MQGSLLANDLRKVISIVDLLRDIGLGSQLSLPKVVVLGNQSSGKSSLLQQIVGLDFLPRGSGVVTRRPLQLRMNNIPNLAAPYGEFDQVVQKGAKKKFTNFNQVRSTIEELTDKVCGKSKDIIDNPIVLNVFSKSCPTLTMVDLPGITSIPVGGQPSNIYDITKNMALRYISEPRSIILCVIPANQDLATSQALKIMRQIDPTGSRSIGCLTKIDIMNRGDDARKMLKNEEIPLRYGYVGIKNRCQQDVINNVPVEESLKAEKKFFTTSPIYSSLPSDLFGTESLTHKLTSILYQQIKASLPEIFVEIKDKKKKAQEQLEKLGPGVTNTDADMVNYAWKSVASFLRIFKNSINGIKSNDYPSDPISSEIRGELNQLYQEQYDEAATEEITDKDIQKTMINFPGESTIPGFPSIDAFLALLNPLLKRLQNPAYEINNKVHEILENEALDIIDKVLTTKYPEFNSRFRDLIRKILDKYRRNLESYLNFMLDSELNYLYTNDVEYLVGDFMKQPKEAVPEGKKKKDPLVYQLRKRIDAYYKLTVRNLRDLIPKQVFNFLLIKCVKQLEFEAFQFTSDVDRLKEWLNEPSEVRLRRTECVKAIKVFEESQKKIRMDPEISKLIRTTDRESKYYQKFGMKSPDQIREQEQKKTSEHFAMLNKSKPGKKPTPAAKAPEPKSDRKPDPKNPPPSQGGAAQQPQQPVKPPQPQPSPSQPAKQQPAQPAQQNPKPTTPQQQQGGQNGQGTFNVNDFFGKDPKQAQQGGKSPSGPAQPNQPNQPQTKPDFTNFFGTGTGGNTQPHSQPSNPNPLNPGPRPTMPVLPVAEKVIEKKVAQEKEKKPEEKKKTFNKLFGI